MPPKQKLQKFKNAKKDSAALPCVKGEHKSMQSHLESTVSMDTPTAEMTSQSSACNGIEPCTHSMTVENEMILPNANGIAQAAESSEFLAEENAEEESTIENEKENLQPMQIVVILPDENTLSIQAMPSDMVAFVLQSILDQPKMVSYSCSGLYYDNELLKDNQEIGSVFTEKEKGTELYLKPLDYTERDVRVHLMRIRNLLLSHSSRIHPSHFSLDSGMSLFKKVTENALASEKDFEQAISKHTEHGFDFTQIELGPMLLASLPNASEVPETLVTLSVSGWNPAPAWRRIRGDFMYLQATFPDSNTFQITATCKGFFKNRSTHTSFDPTPDSQIYHSLLNLLSNLSSEFNEKVKALLQLQQSEHTIATPEKMPILTTLPAMNWQVKQETKEDHLFDPLRGLGGIGGGETVLDTSAMDSVRDWNEELQLYRTQAVTMEPNPQDEKTLESEANTSVFWRIRQYGITYNQFVHTAIQGAMGVLSGSVPPIALPDTESKDDLLYLWNNLFFSFAEANAPRFKNENHVDPYLAARVHASKDVQGIQHVENMGVKGLHTMPMVVLDLQGHRIVAQCLIPGIIGNPNGAKIVYGSVEDQDAPFGAPSKRHLKSDPEFHALVGEVAKKMMWKEHTALDEKNGEAHTLYSSAETRGIMGHDGRKYLFDLARFTPLDKPFLDMAKKDGFLPYLHGLTLLRYELLSNFQDFTTQTYLSQRYQEEKQKILASQRNQCITASSSSSSLSEDTAKSNETSDKTVTRPAEAETSIEIDLTQFLDSVPHLAYNPDQFTSWGPDAMEESAEIEELTRLYEYLYKTVIPALVEDLSKVLPIPTSGLNLTSILHTRGLNMRHLGKFLNAVEESLNSKKQLPGIRVRLAAVATLVKREMWVRSFKHIVRHYLKQADQPTQVVSHLFTALLSISQLLKTSEKLPALLATSIPFPSSYQDISPGSLCALLIQQVTVRFRYHLKPSFDFVSHQQAILRECCLRLGVQLKAKSFAPSFVIAEEDVVNLVPIVKACQIKSPLCQSHLELAQSLLQSGKIANGLATLEHAFYMFEQSFSPLHLDTLLVQTCLADVYHSLYNEQKEALYLQRALELQRSSVIGFERLTGLDSYETASAYHVLATLEFAASQFGEALIHVTHSAKLYHILYGTEHPDWVPHLALFARIYAKLNRLDLSVHAWAMLKDYYVVHFGPDEPATASAYFHLSQYVYAQGQPKVAVPIARKAYSIWMAKFGVQDYRTKEAGQFLNQMTRQAVQSAASSRQSNADSKTPALSKLDKQTSPSPTATVPSKADLTIEEQLAYINGYGESGRRTPTNKKAAHKANGKTKKASQGHTQTENKKKVENVEGKEKGLK